MISFNYESDFKLEDEKPFKNWLNHLIGHHSFKAGDLNYVFCDDAYLLEINQKYLQHDDFTDIITFDYCVGKKLQSDIFVSVERVAENAVKFQVSFEHELKRVMSHGILHLMGYKDKSEIESTKMRSLEDDAIEMFHVEQNDK